MRIDNEVHAGYWSIREGTVARTVSLDDVVLVDLDASGKVLGVEVLDLPFGAVLSST